MTPAPVRVIGIGSPFGADRAGWDVAEALRQRPPRCLRGRDLEVVLCRAPAADLYDALRGGGDVVVVDAVCDGRAPGTVTAWSGEAALCRAGALSSHGIGLGDVFGLLAALGEAPRSVTLLGISVAGQDRALDGAARRRAVEGAARRVRDVAAATVC